MAVRPGKAGELAGHNGLTTGRLPAPLYGREQCLELIDRAIDQIEVAGTAILMTGEAGIGKSAVLDVAKRRAEERRLSVVTMIGIPAEVHLPFAALEFALRPLMKRVKELPPPQQSALLTAFGLRDDVAAPDKFLVGLATLSLLTDSAAHRPILLIADDAQWLDQETCDILAFVARRLRSDPIVLMAAIREGFGHPFGGAEITRVRLARLNNADAEAVLNGHAPNLSPELRARILEQAAGNPLALVELPQTQRVDGGEAPWLPLTERLERAFSDRLSELPAPTRGLLLITAENDRTSLREIMSAGEVILGKPIELDLLAPAVAANLVEIDETEIRFRHPLVRSAIHQAADLAMRHKAHAVLAMVISDHLDRRLWHQAAATIGADEKLALEHDRMAARALRRGAVAMAIEVLESAARLSDTVDGRRDRLLHAAELAADLGKPDLLERLLRQAEVEETDVVASARIGWCREICRQPMVNDSSKIPALVDLAEKALGSGADDLARNLLWRAAQRCWWSHADSAISDKIMQFAAQLDGSTTDPRIIAISAYVEPLGSGTQVHATLRQLSERGNHDPAAARILGSTANVIGAFDLGVAFLRASGAALREQGRLSDLARVLFAQAWAEMEICDWVSAVREAEEAVQFAEETDAPLWIAAASIVKAKIAGMQGKVEEFESYAAQAEKLIIGIGANFLLAMLQLARGVAALGAGRHDAAYEHLRRLFAPADPAFNARLQFFGLADFVEAAVHSGNAAAAGAVIEEVERQAAPTPVPWVKTMLRFGKALLAEPEQAENLFLQGAGAEARHWPFLRGRMLLAYGSWLRRQRRPAEARAPLRESRDIMDALGAAPWGERAREELRASGEASRRRSERKWEALTPQELHIAQLASEGLSNKEIGARLYLSHRTVGYHLHRIFTKTGVTSRSNLRSLLAESPKQAS
jgi:DNA-binding CsgD family transcriptional regulator